MTAKIFALISALVLSACGGGGESEPAESSASCVPLQTVTVQIFGDSTQAGADASRNYRPAALLQNAMDSRYGPGRVLVIDSAVGGTNAFRALAGQHGMAVWPADVRGDIVVANWGVNDATDYSLDLYKSYLRHLKGVTIFETPVPIVPGAGVPDDAFAQGMREVAAEMGVPVADAHAAVRAVPGWERMYGDGFHHPGDDLNAAIVTNALAPAVALQVDALRAAGRCAG